MHRHICVFAAQMEMAFLPKVLLRTTGSVSVMYRGAARDAYYTLNNDMIIVPELLAAAASSCAS